MSSEENSVSKILHNQPAHVGIIMDGNGRWAKLRGKRRIFGHEAGVIKARELVETAVRVDLEALTLYAFSSENWARPKKEVSGLMSLFEKTIEKYTSLLIDNNVYFKTAGDLSKLPIIQKIISSTKAIEYSTLRAKEAANRAIMAINRIPDSKYKNALIAIANYSVDRKS